MPGVLYKKYLIKCSLRNTERGGGTWGRGGGTAGPQPREERRERATSFPRGGAEANEAVAKDSEPGSTLVASLLRRGGPHPHVAHKSLCAPALAGCLALLLAHRPLPLHRSRAGLLVILATEAVPSSEPLTCCSLCLECPSPRCPQGCCTMLTVCKGSSKQWIGISSNNGLLKPFSLWLI